MVFIKQLVCTDNILRPLSEFRNKQTKQTPQLLGKRGKVCGVALPCFCLIYGDRCPCATLDWYYWVTTFINTLGRRQVSVQWKPTGPNSGQGHLRPMSLHVHPSYPHPWERGALGTFHHSMTEISPLLVLISLHKTHTASQQNLGGSSPKACLWVIWNVKGISNAHLPKSI